MDLRRLGLLMLESCRLDKCVQTDEWKRYSHNISAHISYTVLSIVRAILRLFLLHVITDHPQWPHMQQILLVRRTTCAHARACVVTMDGQMGD